MFSEIAFTERFGHGIKQGIIFWATRYTNWVGFFVSLQGESQYSFSFFETQCELTIAKLSICISSDLQPRSFFSYFIVDIPGGPKKYSYLISCNRKTRIAIVAN